MSPSQSERSFQSEFSECMVQFYFPFQLRRCFVYAMRVPYDVSGTSQIKAQLLVATFVKGLYRGRYHNTLTCEDVES